MWTNSFVAKASGLALVEGQWCRRGDAGVHPPRCELMGLQSPSSVDVFGNMSIEESYCCKILF